MGDSPGKGHKDHEGTGASDIWRAAERAQTVYPGEEKAQGDLFNIRKYLKAGCKEDRARLFLVVPSDSTRSSGHKLKHRRLCMNIRNHCEGDSTLAQVAQDSCGVSIPGDTEKLSGHGPGQPALCGPASAGGLDQMTSRGLFQPPNHSMILWTQNPDKSGNPAMTCPASNFKTDVKSIQQK